METVFSVVQLLHFGCQFILKKITGTKIRKDASVFSNVACSILKKSLPCSVSGLYVFDY